MDGPRMNLPRHQWEELRRQVERDGRIDWPKVLSTQRKPSPNEAPYHPNLRLGLPLPSILPTTPSPRPPASATPSAPSTGSA